MPAKKCFAEGGAHSQSVHWNGNIVCALDVETTGLDPTRHEIIQIAVLALNGDLTPNTNILPFYTDIAPLFPERADPKAMRANKLDLGAIMAQGIDHHRCAELFEEWFQRLHLAPEKKIIPLAHNYVFDHGFLSAWLGRFSMDQYFCQHRDSMTLALTLNDLADMHNDPCPFARVGLNSLCNTLKVVNHHMHDALSDAVACAECYRLMMTRYKIYGHI